MEANSMSRIPDIRPDFLVGKQEAARRIHAMADQIDEKTNVLDATTESIKGSFKGEDASTETSILQGVLTAIEGAELAIVAQRRLRRLDVSKPLWKRILAIP